MFDSIFDIVNSQARVKSISRSSLDLCGFFYADNPFAVSILIIIIISLLLFLCKICKINIFKTCMGFLFTYFFVLADSIYVFFCFGRLHLRDSQPRKKKIM